ncbi:MAG: J domain-containing protein [Acidobacteria bacterium]|nr:J domain-containing protein [Acidobacteriota bacterium]
MTRTGDTDHYAVLGVAESASTAEIRRAYLGLARTHHPDFHESTDAASRSANEREMQRINQAWTVLSDPDRRRRYDEQRRTPMVEERFRPAPADYTFVPFDDDDTDYAALIDDAVEGTGVPAWMQLLPVLLLLGGIAGIILGVMVNLSVLLSLGLIGMVLGGLGFLASPALAIARSRSHERPR